MSTHPAVKNGAYDVARVRQDFPALAMQVYGKPLVISTTRRLRRSLSRCSTA
ncbi:hypothetical protein [Bradyrhizobium betae]|uniref:hypothetical protein n=1 Tax=Bradyrhizobium betae TaxID=244734 RepID=UPI001FCE9A7E|nr:hypothetical protein [Bradyrhizobium betae]